MRRIATACMAVGVAGVVLTGCGSGSGGSDSSGAGESVQVGEREMAEAGATGEEEVPETTGMLSEAEARRVIERYVEINNQANAAIDRELIAQVEDGHLLRRSQATLERSTEEAGILTAEERAMITSPYGYRVEEVYIPAGQGWWMASAVQVPIEGSVEGVAEVPKVLVFEASDEDGAEGEDWRMVASVVLDEGEELPEIARDASGLAVAADPTEAVGDLSPAQVPEAYEDVWVEGARVWEEGASLGRFLDADAPAVEEYALDAQEDATEQSMMMGSTRLNRFEPALDDAVTGEVYALETADGGVVTVMPLAHRRISVQLVQAELIDVASREEGVPHIAYYDPTPRNRVRVLHVGEGVAHLSPDAPARMLGAYYGLVDAD